MLHDYAFDEAYGYIEPHIVKLGDTSYDEEGNYLELERVFDFIDLDYLEALFADDSSILSVLMDQQEAKMRDAAGKDLNREQRRKNSSQIENAIQSSLDATNAKLKEISTIIGALRSLIPYNRMLFSSDGYLVPLDDQYFRIDPKNLGFKYGGFITCIGMVTNIIGTSTDPADSNNVFATLQYQANEALRAILPTKQTDLCVIHPIAVYYGK